MKDEYTTITVSKETHKKLSRAKYDGEYTSYDEMFSDWLREEEINPKNLIKVIKKPTKDRK
jgi:hypothetical protein